MFLKYPDSTSTTCRVNLILRYQVRVNAFLASSCSYLYQSIVSSIIKTIPRTLFPVFQRGLGLLTFCSLASFRAGWSHRSTVSFGPISPTDPGRSRDSWYTVDCTTRLGLQVKIETKLIKIIFLSCKGMKRSQNKCTLVFMPSSSWFVKKKFRAPIPLPCVPQVKFFFLVRSDKPATPRSFAAKTKKKLCTNAII